MERVTNKSAQDAKGRIGWVRDDAWLAFVGPALIFVGHVLYGAMRAEVALWLTFLAGLLLVVCLFRPRLRTSLTRLEGLWAPALLFGATIAVAILSLTPLSPGGSHPTWAFLHLGPPAATIDKSATLLEIIKLLGLGCLFVVGAASGGSDSRARMAVNTIIGLGAALAVWSFLTFVTGNQARGGPRLEATFLSANTAGTVLATLFILCAGPAVSRLNGPRGQRLTGATIFGVSALLFLITLFATASRGAFIAAGAGLVVFGLLLVFAGRLKWSRAVFVSLSAIALIFVLLALAGDLLLTRLLGSTHEFASRTAIFQVHWRAFLDSPLMGYGLGSFDTVNRMLLNTQSFPQIWSVRAAHSLYLAWLEQAGLLGAAPMFACVAMIVLLTLRRSLQRTRMTNVIFALVAVDVVFVTHGGTDFALEMFSVAAMWAYLLGLQFGVAQGSSRQ